LKFLLEQNKKDYMTKKTDSGPIKIGSLVRVLEPSDTTDWAGQVGICIGLFPMAGNYDIRVLITDRRICFYSDELEVLVVGA